jgi:drug/metabolite transporter (DMT)-like permease
MAWGGVALGFAGAALIALAAGGGVHLSGGALLVLGAAAAQATFFVSQKALLGRYGSLAVTAWAMGLGAAMALPLAPEWRPTSTRRRPRRCSPSPSSPSAPRRWAS